MDDLILNETKNFKILLIGASGSGKTTLTKKLSDEEPPTEYKASIISEFTMKNIMFQGFDVTLQLWDIVGDNMVSKSFLRGTDGIILVTDLTSQQSSLNDAVDLFRKIKIISGLDKDESFPCIIAGNKHDLLTTRSRDISEIALEEWKQQICPANKNAHIFEISAKSGYNVNEMLQTMLKILLGKPSASNVKSRSFESAIRSNFKDESVLSNIPPDSQSIKAKVVLAGKAAVGKTCILSRNSRADHTINTDDTYEPTAGADFRVIDIPVLSKNISLQIWDSAGSNITKAIYKNADCLILVYDISSRESFIDLELYWDYFMRYAQPTDVYEFPVLLVGNKCDLDSKRAVHIEEIMDWCAYKRPRKPISYIECSALLNMGVRDVFLFIAEAMYEYKIYVIDEYIDDDESRLDTTNYEHYDDSKSSHYSNSNFGTDYSEDSGDKVLEERKNYSSPKQKHKNKDANLERNCFVEFLKELNCM